MGDSSSTEGGERFDLFISHASEDKARVVRPLTVILQRRGLTVWLDERQLTIGDSLSLRIEEGLAHSRFGVVVISPAFAPKAWPQRELAGLNARELSGGTKVILPVWHEVDFQFVADRFPILADRLGARTSAGLENVADQIILAMQRAEGAGQSSKGVEASLAKRQRRARLRGMLGGGFLAALVSAAVFALAPEGLLASGKPSLPGSASTSDFELSFPPGWRRGSPQTPTTDPPTLDKPLMLEAPGGSGTLTVGFAKSTSPTLLPASLLAALPRTPRKEAVKLDDHAFYRYRDLKPHTSPVPETIYALPSTTGVVLGICKTRQFSVTVDSRCEQIVASIQLLTGDPVDLGPQSSYAVALSRVFSQLNRDRARLGENLARSKTAAGQADAAQLLANAHQLAGASLRIASPGPAEQAASKALIGRLDETALSYARMASAARTGNSGRFDSARAAVASDSARIRQAVAVLGDFGYRVDS